MSAGLRTRPRMTPSFIPPLFDDSGNLVGGGAVSHRAVRRMGELLKQFDAQGRRTDQLKDSSVQKFTQAQAAAHAGISERQRKTAVRVANVPAEKFEAAIETETSDGAAKIHE